MGWGLGSHRCTMTWRPGPFLPGSSFLPAFLSWGVSVSGGQDSATRCSRAFLGAPTLCRQPGDEATCCDGGRGPSLVLVSEAKGVQLEGGLRWD